jgi:hypothetical protein
MAIPAAIDRASERAPLVRWPINMAKNYRAWLLRRA